MWSLCGGLSAGRPGAGSGIASGFTPVAILEPARVRELERWYSEKERRGKERREFRGVDMVVIPETVIFTLIPIFDVTGFTGFPDL